MIVAITCRHDTESEILRRRAEIECRSLTRLLPAIKKIRLIFYRESRHAVAPDLIACHISIQIPNRQHIDVYEYSANAYLAFNTALDKATSEALRLNFKQQPKLEHKHFVPGIEVGL